jgi:hypothetical protein
MTENQIGDGVSFVLWPLCDGRDSIDCGISQPEMPMPALKNARHELFAQLICEGAKRGWSHGAAYSRAGYKAEGHAAEVAASRLLKNVENGIAARVQEIVGRGARRAEVTVESLLNELDDVLAGAMSSGQYAAARAVIDSKARLKGLFIDRVEVGAPTRIFPWVPSPSWVPSASTYVCVGSPLLGPRPGSRAQARGELFPLWPPSPGVRLAPSRSAGF